MLFAENGAGRTAATESGIDRRWTQMDADVPVAAEWLRRGFAVARQGRGGVVKEMQNAEWEESVNFREVAPPTLKLWRTGRI